MSRMKLASVPDIGLKPSGPLKRLIEAMHEADVFTFLLLECMM